MLCPFQDGISCKRKIKVQEAEKSIEEEGEVATRETTIFGLSNIPIVCKTEEVCTEELLVEEVSGIVGMWLCAGVDKKT